MYKLRKSFIEQRETTIAEKEIKQRGKELHEYLLKLQQYTKQWQLVSIDPHSLSRVIN